MVRISVPIAGAWRRKGRFAFGCSRWVLLAGSRSGRLPEAMCRQVSGVFRRRGSASS